MRKCVVLLACISFLFTTGCINPQKEEIYGIWESGDKAQIYLKRDGTFSAKNFNLYKIFPFAELKNKSIVTNGTWIFDHETQKVEMTFPNLGKMGGRATFGFDISGAGILEIQKPYHLYHWIGDPDNAEKYKFERVGLVSK